jgi:outer membrane protein
MNALIVLLVFIGTAAASQIPERLTLADAERHALNNHPALQAADLDALAARERIDQAEAGRQPFVTASVTGAGAPENSRLAAGALNNPVIYSRVATGFSVNQLLFDFGRTSRLVESSKYAADAMTERSKVTRADVLLAVHRAYYSALRSNTVVQVARQTVESRQLIVDQVSELVKAQLKSSLDLSFASTNLAEAKLLLAAADNDRRAAMAALSQAMGFAAPQAFELAEEPLPNIEPLSVTELTQRALRDRPELAAAKLDIDSMRSVASAENALRYPAVTATASAGFLPTHAQALSGDYAAIGVNVSLPFLNGGLYKARKREAEFRAGASERRLRETENRIARDVAVAILDLTTAQERITLTQQFVEQANQALELAQSRYDLGLSSIVELSQAQLVKTNADIQYVTARYDYQVRRSVLNYHTGTLK